MLNVAIMLSGKKTPLTVQDCDTVRDLILLYKFYNTNGPKRLSLKTKQLGGIKVDKHVLVKAICDGKIYKDETIQKHQSTGEYILYAEVENPQLKKSKCTVM
mgnify:FL=1